GELAGSAPVCCRAPPALRTRVTRSATPSFGTPTIFGRGLRTGATRLAAGRSGGALRSPSLGADVAVVVVVSSVISTSLPAGLRHARQLALEGVLPEADAAQTELAH